MFKPWYKQPINVDSSLLTCTKASLSLQHHRLHFSHCYASGTLKICPNLKDNVQLFYQTVIVVHKGGETGPAGPVLAGPFLKVKQNFSFTKSK